MTNAFLWFRTLCTTCAQTSYAEEYALYALSRSYVQHYTHRCICKTQLHVPVNHDICTQMCHLGTQIRRSQTRYVSLHEDRRKEERGLNFRTEKSLSRVHISLLLALLSACNYFFRKHDRNTKHPATSPLSHQHHHHHLFYLSASDGTATRVLFAHYAHAVHLPTNTPASQPCICRSLLLLSLRKWLVVLMMRMCIPT